MNDIPKRSEFGHMNAFDTALARIAEPSDTGRWLESLTPVLERQRAQREAEAAMEAAGVEMVMGIIEPVTGSEYQHRLQEWDRTVSALRVKLEDERMNHEPIDPMAEYRALSADLERRESEILDQLRDPE